jgi:hypothetical protein
MPKDKTAQQIKSNGKCRNSDEAIELDQIGKLEN